MDTTACPRFVGRVVSHLESTARSPVWLRERLRRAGLRPIHPIVDVTNYVMLELGQPLHAYRLDKLSGPIEVRFARQGERLTLLDASDIKLDDATLVIADQSGPIGLAGIMGGLSTAVDAATADIFLESAFFAPEALQGRARRYGLHTDASIRFERGVDPTGQERAIERASALLLEIAGGRPGPIVIAEDESALPQREPIRLREQRVKSVLGVVVDARETQRLLELLGMQVEAVQDGWQVTAPSYRFDIAIEEDLIEELGRMIGYDLIPTQPGSSAVHLGQAPEAMISVDALSDLLAARGYNEVVSYGFTEAEAQARIAGTADAVHLANPISQDLNVLRNSLWPGLLRSARLNQSHQVDRCRLFEAGTVFQVDGDGVAESQHLAALITGTRHPASWENANSAADFFDLKGDLESLLSSWRDASVFRFLAEVHPALNPSRSAAIYQGDRSVGWIGELHPRLQSEYDLRQPVVLFAVDLSAMQESTVPKFAEYSKYPSVRRDLAVVVDESVNAADLTKLISDVLGESLKRHEIFDLYRGQGVDTGRKSIGIGLILQGASRTLTDEETDGMIQQVVRHLEHELGARIRN
jgi:phenylalanyl-tRNA synthetase beta chain